MQAKAGFSDFFKTKMSRSTCTAALHQCQPHTIHVIAVAATQCATVSAMLHCSQSPIFPWDFRDSYASIELQPSWFVKASAIWGECLNYYRGVEGGGLVRVR